MNFFFVGLWFYCGPIFPLDLLKNLVSFNSKFLAEKLSEQKKLVRVLSEFYIYDGEWLTIKQLSVPTLNYRQAL